MIGILWIVASFPLCCPDNSLPWIRWSCSEIICILFLCFSSRHFEIKLNKRLIFCSFHNINMFSCWVSGYYQISYKTKFVFNLFQQQHSKSALKATLLCKSKSKGSVHMLFLFLPIYCATTKLESRNLHTIETETASDSLHDVRGWKKVFKNLGNHVIKLL